MSVRIRGAKGTARLIPGWPDYAVTTEGEVWSKRREKTRWRRLRPGECGHAGHLHVGVSKDGKRYYRKVHHLVLEAFVGPRPAWTECCHGDGNPKNNALSNLRWDTRKENMADRDRHGTMVRGELVGNAKLTADLVRTIRELRFIEKLTQREIAEYIGVSQSAVADVLLRKKWKHVR